jgi:formylglycine-generating enzyme required for sulfatase activity
MTRFALAVALASAACGGPPSPRTFADAPAGMQFVRLGPGAFEMGSPERETGRELQERQHRVRLTRPFYLARTEVTQGQWQQVMGTNPSHFAGCGPDCPVERVTYADVMDFLRRVNGGAAGGYRLPTEAEWEYACRAGGTLPFGHTSALDSTAANINGLFPYGAAPTTESAGTVPVGRYPANPWGFFDMSGNVWEWTADDHCPYPEHEVVDPRASCGVPLKVIRGGSWKFDGNSARCALRYTHRPQDRGFSLGFRLARDEVR